MTRKGKQNSGSNRDRNNSGIGSESKGGNRNRTRSANSSHRGRGGRDRDNNNDRRRNDVHRPPPTHLRVPEINASSDRSSTFLANNVIKMLETLVQRNFFADNQVSAEELLRRERYAFIPSSLRIFFLIITQYQQYIQQRPLSATSTDPLVKSLETRNYLFVILEKEMNNMYKLLNNGRINLIDGQDPNKKESISRLNSLNHYKDLARKVDATRLYYPPDELSNSGKRHDNDFEKISKISVIPTKEEILCEYMPFLPFTVPDEPHFLPDGIAKLHDIQFRFLREDMLNLFVEVYRS
ncbi:14621_t:CDS:2 [Funneliformis mosseae]|uniref:14621_t:CDS:1 n=1 Tax=Funneliformis mosseae TaxID=27381 RepID=A0A9N9HKW7_FUNMO|nr:14621_t:CDS:2 [Funneliformis mosseae]